MKQIGDDKLEISFSESGRLIVSGMWLWRVVVLASEFVEYMRERNIPAMLQAAKDWEIALGRASELMGEMRITKWIELDWPTQAQVSAMRLALENIMAVLPEELDWSNGFPDDERITKETWRVAHDYLRQIDGLQWIVENSAGGPFGDPEHYEGTMAEAGLEVPDSGAPRISVKVKMSKCAPDM